VIQYTAISGLAAHAARTKQALDTKHLVFDIGGDTEAQYRQALRECTELILPISISTIETITLNAALATAEDVATEADREINSQVLLCGVDHHDKRELAEAREAAEHPSNNWPLLDTHVPYLKRYRKAFGTCPHHTGAYENVVRAMITSQIATAAG
jgi:hypothetical protein